MIDYYHHGDAYHTLGAVVLRLLRPQRSTRDDPDESDPTMPDAIVRRFTHSLDADIHRLWRTTQGVAPRMAAAIEPTSPEIISVYSSVSMLEYAGTPAPFLDVSLLF
ncbi:hypothetical protein MMC22_004609 [Lobaria immixta]|nr:hypothetical protein [Lobaria immixta]